MNHSFLAHFSEALNGRADRVVPSACPNILQAIQIFLVHLRPPNTPFLPLKYPNNPSDLCSP
jgi:hypothetical protein